MERQTGQFSRGLQEEEHPDPEMVEGGIMVWDWILSTRNVRQRFQSNVCYLQVHKYSRWVHRFSTEPCRTTFQSPGWGSGGCSCSIGALGRRRDSASSKGRSCSVHDPHRWFCHFYGGGNKSPSIKHQNQKDVSSLIFEMRLKQLLLVLVLHRYLDFVLILHS